MHVQVVSPTDFDVIAGETITQAPTSESIVLPATMLEGLSKIGVRVRDAAQATASRVSALFGIGANIPADTEIPRIPDTATPAPVPPTVPESTPSSPETPSTPTPPNTPPTPQASRTGFIQGGINILGALIQGVVGLFTDK